MPYLTVLGKGSWGPDAARRFAAGVHEVDHEVAEAARASGIKTLVVTDGPPRVRRRGAEGPLSADDIVEGSDGRVELEPAEEGASEEGADAYDFGCPSCGRSFPSAAARDRHQAFRHQ